MDFRLRGFLDSLGPDELQRIDSTVELADVAATLESNRKAVWFTRAGAEGASLAGNVAASRSRLAHAFGTTPEGLLQEVLRRLKNKGEIIESKAAPVHEVIETEPDLTALPVHLQHGLDGAPNAVLENPDVRQRFANSGLQITGGPPQDFAAIPAARL